MTKVERVPLTDLQLWPGNPRKGNKRLIRESLQQFGQTRPLHARRADGHVMMGNNTLECMQDLGFEHADVIYHDVDEATARRVMLMDNRTADLGFYDDMLIAEMLQQLDGDYEGTGWTADEADKYFELLQDDGQDDYWELDDDADDDETVVEISHVSSTGAAYAENPLAQQQRADRQAQQITHNVAGTRELVLVYSNAEHAEVMSMLSVLKTGKYDGLRVPQIIYRLLEAAANGN